MTKRIICMTVLIGLFFLPLSNQVRQIYVKEGNIWEGAFTEPFEILYVLCENGDIYAFTTQQERMVNLSAPQLCEFLKTRKHDISEVIYMIHNHFGFPFMSENNIGFMRSLRERGFTGVFSMIDTATGKMVCIRNDNGKIL